MPPPDLTTEDLQRIEAYCQQDWFDRTELRTDLPRLVKAYLHLLSAVKEWLCEKCRMVYPGPPQQGFACVQCPKCRGDCGPRLIVENRTLLARQGKLERLANDAGKTLHSTLQHNEAITFTDCPVPICQRTQQTLAALEEP